jgi:hypothetical protein
MFKYAGFTTGPHDKFHQTRDVRQGRTVLLVTQLLTRHGSAMPHACSSVIVMLSLETGGWSDQRAELLFVKVRSELRGTISIYIFC